MKICFPDFSRNQQLIRLDFEDGISTTQIINALKS